MSYLKVWMGTVSGSPGGRDDGYPEQKTRVVDELEELVRTFDPKAVYYRLEEIPSEDMEAVVRAVNDFG